ncbi:MAG: DNA polymerase III subunit delta [Thermovenabulum sp.]|uniref:DNA polymerase III subunit delta n=1 Tax=Thermovenabulum sp. TaxID=3100335 RepID=UPI003C79D60D
MIYINKNVFLLYGSEGLLIKEAVEKIKLKYLNKITVDLDFVKLDGEEVDFADIIDSCLVVPLLSEKRVIYVKDANFLSETKSSKKNEEEKLANFIEKEFPDYTCLILTAEKIDKRKKVYKAIEKVGYVKEFKISNYKEKIQWIKKRALLYNKNLDESAAAYIAYNTGDLYQTDNEIKKIVFALEEKKLIKKEDIEEIMSRNEEANIFELIDCIMENKKNIALLKLAELFKKGEKGILILYMISKHFMNLCWVKMLGDNEEEIREKLGLHPFVVKKLIEQARNFSIEKLKYALNLSQQLDYDIKKGRIDDKTGLELLISRL